MSSRPALTLSTVAILISTLDNPHHLRAFLTKIQRHHGAREKPLRFVIDLDPEVLQVVSSLWGGKPRVELATRGMCDQVYQLCERNGIAVTDTLRTEVWDVARFVNVAQGLSDKRCVPFFQAIKKAYSQPPFDKLEMNDLDDRTMSGKLRNAIKAYEWVSHTIFRSALISAPRPSVIPGLLRTTYLGKSNGFKKHYKAGHNLWAASGVYHMGGDIYQVMDNGDVVCHENHAPMQQLWRGGGFHRSMLLSILALAIRKA